MKISKALKLKNRLAGEIGRLKTLIQTSNVVKNGVEREHDVVKNIDDLNKTVASLIDVKTAIALGNTGRMATTQAINDNNHKSIFAMAELKGLIEFYKSIPTTHGKVTEGSFMRGDPIEATYDAAIRRRKSRRESRSSRAGSMTCRILWMPIMRPPTFLGLKELRFRFLGDGLDGAQLVKPANDYRPQG